MLGEFFVCVSYLREQLIRPFFHDRPVERDGSTYVKLVARPETIEIEDPSEYMTMHLLLRRAQLPRDVATVIDVDPESNSSNDVRIMVTGLKDDVDTHTRATIDKRKKKKKVKVQKVKSSDGAKNDVTGTWWIVGSFLVALIPMAL